MFVLPLGDSPNPKGTPYATYALIAANVLVYAILTVPLGLLPPETGDPRVAEYLAAIANTLPESVSLQRVAAQLTQYDLFVFEHGFRPAAASTADLFASLFLHGGFAHLFGNMLFLWIHGDNVEHRLGWPRYLFYYLATGAAATLFHAAFNRTSQIPLVGASGAISGVLGFYFLWFPHNTVRLLAGIFPFFVRQIQLPSRVVLGFYLIVDNLLPFLLLPGSGVAHGAHIGGFLAGLGAAWFLDQRSLSAPPDFEVSPAEVAEPPSREQWLADTIAAERFEEAARYYFAVPAERTRHLLKPRDSLALAHWLWTTGHPRAALTLYQRQVRDTPKGSDAARAHLGAGLLLLHVFDQPAAAYQHLVEALMDSPAPDVAERAREALAAIEADQGFFTRAR